MTWIIGGHIIFLKLVFEENLTVTNLSMETRKEFKTAAHSSIFLQFSKLKRQPRIKLHTLVSVFCFVLTTFPDQFPDHTFLKYSKQGKTFSFLYFFRKGIIRRQDPAAQYTYQDSKPLAPVFCFACLVQTGVWVEMAIPWKNSLHGDRGRLNLFLRVLGEGLELHSLKLHGPCRCSVSNWVQKTYLHWYSLINMRQLHIFSIKPKLDMGLFVDFCVFN